MTGGEKPDDADAPTATRTARAESQPLGELEQGGSIGRYKLVSRLGAGAMGVVWCALDPQLDRKIAIKVVHGKFSRSSESSQRLLREARAMAKLSHRAVVTVHDAGETEGRLFLAMELVEGTTLGHMLRIRNDAERRDWRKWLGMMLEAGRGLEAAHKSGILHRDFKPYNVLVDDAGRVCVADFGLATLGDDPAVIGGRVTKTRLLELTTTGAVLGTPAYMSLQQLRGETVDARADQFSFCVATYEALYGRRPFAAQSEGWEVIDALEAAIESGAILLPPVDSPVPVAVFDVLQRGLAANPEKRWTSMSALLFALERARDGKRTDAHTEVLRPQPPAQRWLLVGLGAAALAVVALIVLVLARGSSTRPARAPKRLFDVPLKTKLAATPDGKRLLLANDRIEVRDLTGGMPPWTALLASDVSGVMVTEREVTFGTHEGVLSRWRYATDGKVEKLVEHFDGLWCGETVAGQVLLGPPLRLRVVDGDQTVREWALQQTANAIEISPDGRRVAIIEADRFYGEIVIRDVTRDVVIRSRRLENPTALAWQDDQTLVYSTGGGIQPTIFRVRITSNRLGDPEVVYHQDIGWFGDLAVGGNRLFAIEMAPKPRARVVDLATHSSSELDASTIGAALAWLDGDAYLIWNRNTRRVERRNGSAAELTSITLDGEPGNVTMAGDVLIVAVRMQTGRDIVAHALTTGERLWSLQAPWTFAVRCADDRRPPCFALTRAADGNDQLRAIDPQTGALGDVLQTGPIEDLAVNAAGDRVVLAMRGGLLREVAPDGAELARYASELTTVRSVAYDRGGGSFLVAGTIMRNVFQLGRLADGKLTVIVQAENDLLSLVRPSNDGQRLIVNARIYAPVLWEMLL